MLGSTAFQSSNVFYALRLFFSNGGCNKIPLGLVVHFSVTVSSGTLKLEAVKVAVTIFTTCLHSGAFKWSQCACRNHSQLEMKKSMIIHWQKKRLSIDKKNHTIFLGVNSPPSPVKKLIGERSARSPTRFQLVRLRSPISSLSISLLKFKNNFISSSMDYEVVADFRASREFFSPAAWYSHQLSRPPLVVSRCEFHFTTDSF